MENKTIQSSSGRFLEPGEHYRDENGTLWVGCKSSYSTKDESSILFPEITEIFPYSINPEDQSYTDFDFHKVSTKIDRIELHSDPALLTAHFNVGIVIIGTYDITRAIKLIGGRLRKYETDTIYENTVQEGKRGSFTKPFTDLTKAHRYAMINSKTIFLKQPKSFMQYVRCYFHEVLKVFKHNG
jgi:hypothetical protein